MMETAKIASGVKVFGSAKLGVAPDVASIVMAVSCVEKEPKDAFERAKRKAAAVQEFLGRMRVGEFGSSQIALEHEHRHVGGEYQFVGYRASISYSVVLRELGRMEELLTGAIAAGANRLTSVTFETTRLKELRAVARRRAVAAAREKAMLYAEAAGVKLGAVVAIEDVSPEVLSDRFEGHSRREPVIDDAGELKAMDPGAITVGAAVRIVYQLGSSRPSDLARGSE